MFFSKSFIQKVYKYAYQERGRWITFTMIQKFQVVYEAEKIFSEDPTFIPYPALWSQWFMLMICHVSLTEKWYTPLKEEDDANDAHIFLLLCGLHTLINNDVCNKRNFEIWRPIFRFWRLISKNGEFVFLLMFKSRGFALIPRRIVHCNNLSKNCVFVMTFISKTQL